MGKRYIFVATKHEEYGNMGWTLKGSEVFEPLGGMAVSHDMLEHGYHKQAANDMQEELMALGASLYVRNYGGYFIEKGQHIPKNVSAYVHNMRYELNSIYDYYLRKLSHTQFEIDLMEPYKRTAAIEDYDYELVDAADAIVKNISVGDESLDLDWEYVNPDHVRSMMLSCLRIGYRNAVRRYNRMDLDSYKLCYLFMEIETQANKRLSQVMWEGQEMEVHLDTKHRCVECKLIEEEYDDDY